MWPFRRRRRPAPPAPAAASRPAPTPAPDRVVRLHGPLDDELARQIVSHLLFHTYEDARRPITLDIDSPGGSVSAAVAVADAIRTVSAPVHTRCLGRAAGGAAVLLAAGARGHRAVGAAAAVSLVPVGSAEPYADDRDRRLVADLLAAMTGRPVDPVATAVAVGAIFSPAEAVAYGLADAVVPDLPGADRAPPADPEAERAWLAGEDPVDMLALLGERITDRKAALLGVACFRRLPAWRGFPAAEAAAAVAERWADGEATDENREAAYRAASQALELAGRVILGDPDGEEPHDGTAGYYAVDAAAALVGPEPPARLAAGVVWACGQGAVFGDHTPGRARAAAERRAQVALARCVLGHPFRPVAFDPRWRSADAVGVARGIYDERAFDRLPVLADALMDAGCADEQVIGHCRGEGPHVRGCWVVDLVLGRE